MPLRQIRDAAIASRFPTKEALDDWLSVVLDENRVWLDRACWHTRQALALCPIQGDGYVHLAELGFLNGTPAEAKRAYIQQALTVRPYSGLVLMAAGGEAFLAGDTVEAMSLWKRAFHQDPGQQHQIISMLAAQMPVAAFLEQFQPDLDGLSRLYSFYRRHELIPQALEMADKYADALKVDARQHQGIAASRQWSQSASVYEFLEANDDFVASARQAVQFAPDDFGKRRVLARALVKNKQFAEAVEQLQWCVSREPDDARLQRELQAVYCQRLASQQAASDR